MSVASHLVTKNIAVDDEVENEGLGEGERRRGGGPHIKGCDVAMPPTSSPCTHEAMMHK